MLNALSKLLCNKFSVVAETAQCFAELFLAEAVIWRIDIATYSVYTHTYIDINFSKLIHFVFNIVGIHGCV